MICLEAHCHSTCLEVRDNSVRSALSFYLYVGFRDQTQVTRLAEQTPLTAKPSQRHIYLSADYVRSHQSFTIPSPRNPKIQKDNWVFPESLTLALG